VTEFNYPDPFILKVDNISASLFQNRVGQGGWAGTEVIDSIGHIFLLELAAFLSLFYIIKRKGLSIAYIQRTELTGQSKTLDD
jgi:hypothetical protein